MSRLLILCFLFTIHSSIAQTIENSNKLQGSFLGQELGLLQLNVKGMALDDLGYLWAGTEDGLHKFNGYEFKPYLHNPNDSTTLKDDHVRSLLFANDTLWIATNSKGVLGFILSKNSFFDPLPTNRNLDLNTSYKVLKLGKDFILFSVKNNLIVFNRHTKKTTVISLPNKTRENYVTDILYINNEKYWLATTASGILEFNSNTFELTETAIVSDENILSFYQHDGTIFIGSKDGLQTYDLNTNEVYKTTLSFSVNCFYKLNETQFYIGTENGLFLFDTTSNNITTYSLETKENKNYQIIDINQIIGDANGNLWIGTEGEGLFYYNNFQKKFNTIKLELEEYPLTNHISTFPILKGKDSTLWLGTKYGVVKYNHTTNNFKLYKTKEPVLIYTIVKDKNNTIWAGGYTSGLLKYDEISDTFKKINDTNSPLPDNDVIEIIPIDSNTLWVCTWSGGIHKFSIDKEQFEEIRINGKRINRARTSHVDSKGNIWIGTDEGTYKISKDGSIYHYNSQSNSIGNLSSDRIFSIAEDNRGNIWFGTNVGLTKLNVSSTETTLFYKQKGLPNDFIYNVLIDKNNDVWMSSNFGISILDTQTNTFKNYTSSDGLQDNEFNGKAAYKDVFGNFYFGGIIGLNIFNPENIIEYPYPPKVYIESVDLFNKPLLKNELYKDTLQFKSYENVLTFNFSALNYLNPEKGNYIYKMEGFDSDWRPVTKNRSTTYTNLNPGEYIFKVKASNDAGLWNEIPDSMAIIIIPPWYQTTVFKFGFLILFIFSSVSFYRYKTKKLKKDKLKLEHIVSQRTQEITDKNKSLKSAYNEAEKQRDNIRFLMQELTHRVKNNLQIVSSLLNIQANTLKSKPAIEALKMAKNRILAIAHIENKITIESETIEIGLFIKELSESVIKAISDDHHLKFKTSYDLTKTQIKNINTTMIGLIINELITNTIKYAFDDYNPENKLTITCKVHKKTLNLIISDNGKGYSSDNVSQKSLGIEMVIEMVNQLKGTIEINAMNGTENNINIPI